MGIVIDKIWRQWARNVKMSPKIWTWERRRMLEVEKGKAYCKGVPGSSIYTGDNVEQTRCP